MACMLTCNPHSGVAYMPAGAIVWRGGQRRVGDAATADHAFSAIGEKLTAKN